MYIQYVLGFSSIPPKYKREASLDDASPYFL